MLTEMSKVYIIGLKTHFMEVLKDVHSFGRVHIDDLRRDIESGKAPLASMQRSGELEEQYQALKDLDAKAQSLIMNLFGSPQVLRNACSCTDCASMTNDAVIERATTLYGEIEPTARERAAEIAALQSEQAELQQYEPLLTKLEPTVSELVGSHDLYSTALILESRYRDAITELRNQLMTIADNEATTLVSSLNEDMVALIIVSPLDKATSIHRYITEKQVSQIKLPASFSEQTFSKALEAMHERLLALPDLLEKARWELASFAEEHRAELCEIFNEVADRLEELELIAHMGETDYTFVCAGYLPTSDVEPLKRMLSSDFGPSVVVDVIDIAPDEYQDVPVKLENSKRFRPFQAALGIWGQPVYGTMDPSWLIALSFPFIFGMIVGDAGYGLVLLSICLFFKWKYPNNKAVQAFTGVLAPAGMMTILFGLFYFEFFGNLAHVYIPGLNQIHPLQITENFSIPFIRTSSSMQMTFLAMALGFGVIEVVFGLFLGVKNSARMGERKHVIEKTGLLIIIFSALGLVAVKAVPSLTAGMPAAAAAIIAYVIYALLGVGFITTLWGGGVMGAIETVESASHIASYIRIMAVGLVGALLADAANELVFETMPNVGGFIIAIMLHILNFVIIVFSPSIHALRLTFLEFFGKFWEPGRVSYQPFVRVGKDG